ncbi:bifunctional UDP-3-O-[3-hydroxymyristoyl] N-acetylglucosamine deacetylase/3-hydroxyacyl-ACP dehydratase [Phaeocystidibacter luteus]|uniref:Multifunctional fusion protein n=1 Tax=Phaeocystidibacter luteus TaxID=911197 RepID=A0A6N6RGK7_9FLAO|nr:bifunctional UDP-3-O-[3-hydroxymyristoyl] N-acetylglucosamine deacetylase/3-hydroxyacyl-ACP dehydratase [Phaeocystidibacter luteus]KAB2810285.1 bifunctional UDP-3-O-[3-hydroxymyristoyl] N-acetylglucosamine deacetylase/3-hydroxyacyl-ACP dehydratase [Phaeocystidibacter luteus]
MTHQQTLKAPVTIKGVGLHTGVEVELVLQPAPVDHGFKFQRVDLEGQPIIDALASNVVSTDRGTTLVKGDAKVFTTEHVLAALVGSKIDNCLLQLNAPETPILDGSSKPFMEAIATVGAEEQDAQKREFIIDEVIRYYDEEEDIEILALPSEEYQVTAMVDYQTKVLGSQNAHIDHIDEFAKEIAPARTFSFLHELEFLLDNGLIKGGDLNNAIVYVDKEVNDDTMAKLREAFKKDQVKVKPNGILDNLDLHFPNEAARHKLLDVIGDLALAGRSIRGRIIATKPGHKANTEFAKMLQQIIKKNDAKPKAPKVDLNTPPVFEVTDIMKRLPHRPPFLLVDRILEISDSHVVGMKAVTMNEPFFVGHFPGAPVMPGVLQVEAMAQVGGILALNSVPDPENYLTFFLKIDGVKFKQKVLPGDTLTFRLELTQPIRRGIVQMHGQMFVGDKLVTEADLMAQITKEK